MEQDSDETGQNDGDVWADAGMTKASGYAGISDNAAQLRLREHARRGLNWQLRAVAREAGMSPVCQTLLYKIISLKS